MDTNNVGPQRATPASVERIEAERKRIKIDRSNTDGELLECTQPCAEDLGIEPAATNPWLYRWVYSEGFGPWYVTHLPSNWDDVRVREHMDAVESNEGPSHGVRWSGFEFERVSSSATNPKE